MKLPLYGFLPHFSLQAMKKNIVISLNTFIPEQTQISEQLFGDHLSVIVKKIQ